MRAIDLFAGAGGLSRGFESVGCEIVAGVEWDADACGSFEKAHPTADIIDGDINRVGFGRYRGEVDLVIGGPPCQPWSNGGKRLGTEDPRDGWPGYIRALDELKPDGFLAENVAGLAAASRRDYLHHLVRELEARGFRVSWQVVNAADYGVPQKRRRLIIAGLRDRVFSFPRATHGPGTPQPWRPAGDVVGVEPIGDPNPSIVTYAKSPDLRPSPYDGHVYNGGGRPIDLKAPAPTLLASMGGNKTPWIDSLGVVPEYHAYLAQGGRPRSGKVPGARRITVDEAALLQTFPMGSHFVGTRSSAYRQVGNAVPPLLAEQLARSLTSQLTA